jgi:hypothetical protein
MSPPTRSYDAHVIDVRHNVGQKSLAMIGSAEERRRRKQRVFRADALSIAGLEGSRHRNAAMCFVRVFRTEEANPKWASQ